jgi:hypothetical protein
VLLFGLYLNYINSIQTESTMTTITTTSTTDINEPSAPITANANDVKESPPPYNALIYQLQPDVAKQYEQIKQRHLDELAQFKASLMNAIDELHIKDNAYLTFKNNKEKLLQERAQIEGLTVALTEQQRKALTVDIDIKINMTNSDIQSYINNAYPTHKAIIDSINNQLGLAPLPTDKPPHVLINVSNKDYQKDYDNCLAILKPYIDKTISAKNGTIMQIRLKKTAHDEDEAIYNKLRGTIGHGRAILGYYLKFRNACRYPALVTIFSYLGFSTSIKDHSFILTYKYDLIQRYYIHKSDFLSNVSNGTTSYTINPKYPHDAYNFKGLLL